MWISLLRAGVPTNVWVPRRLWRVALEEFLGLGSAPTLRRHLTAARDRGVVELEARTGRGREDRIRLCEPSEDMLLPELTVDEARALIEEGRAA